MSADSNSKQQRRCLLHTNTARALSAILIAAISVSSCTFNAPIAAPLPEVSDASVAALKAPPGFKVSLYAKVPSARQMVLSPSGTLFVGTRDGGKVYAVRDTDNDGKGDQISVVANELRSPNGVEFVDGALLVAEISRILRFDDIEKNLANPPKPVVVTDKYPTDGHHGWKYIRIGPDGMLYIPVGAPCNVCERKDPYASITRIKLDGSGQEVIARGIRNTVGFDWDPKTKELWFTDNGRDLLGDEKPYDELNHAPKVGMHFGFPYCHGKGISDPEFGSKRKCSEFTPAALELGPHVAALGMKFYDGKMFPADYAGDIIYAEHGSWNRSKKSGYQVARVHMKNGEPQERVPFITGFLQEGDRVIGRPVDVVVMPDGSILVSDDYAGAIYRVTYNKMPPTSSKEQ